MHTLQDFYSHSNWIESGNSKINALIGTTTFNQQPIATKNDDVTCASNCTLVEITCSKFLTKLSDLFKVIGLKTSFSCPLKYYKCKGNIVVLNKLVSGYYSDQELKDGTDVPKPSNSMKCSHGGILDATTYQQAVGGINKDTGYYLLSPHADLHMTAAKLAITHTEEYFNEIRRRIGDKEFSKFLELEVSSNMLNNINQFVALCEGKNLKPIEWFSLLILTSLLHKILI
jgi:von Willebrand factor A domain-containing protein 7